MPAVETIWKGACIFVCPAGVMTVVGLADFVPQRLVMIYDDAPGAQFAVYVWDVVPHMSRRNRHTCPNIVTHDS